MSFGLKRIVQVGVGVAAVVLPLAVGTGQARAQSVPVANEEMMEDQANENLFIARQFGFSGPATLDYNSSIGAGGSSFSYSTVSGQTYNGEPITVGAAGSSTYDPSDATWTWTSASHEDWDNELYTNTDLETITLIPNPNGPGNIYYIVSDFNWYDPHGNKVGDAHIAVAVDPNTWIDADVGYLTDALGNKVPNSDFESVSAYDEETGDWDIDLYPVDPEPYLPIYVNANGTSDPNTGLGTFQTEITVPEPASLGMMGIGAIALLRRASRKRA
jgi:hypothetical protein